MALDHELGVEWRRRESWLIEKNVNSFQQDPRLRGGGVIGQSEVKRGLDIYTGNTCNVS